jgi:hypothetical protein
MGQAEMQAETLLKVSLAKTLSGGKTGLRNELRFRFAVTFRLEEG